MYVIEVQCRTSPMETYVFYISSSKMHYSGREIKMSDEFLFYKHVIVCEFIAVSIYMEMMWALSLLFFVPFTRAGFSRNLSKLTDKYIYLLQPIAHQFEYFSFFKQLIWLISIFLIDCFIPMFQHVL